MFIWSQDPYVCVCFHQVVEVLDIQGVGVFLAACPGQPHVSCALTVSPTEWLIFYFSLTHSFTHTPTHTHPPFLLGLAVTVSTGQVLTTPPNWSFASSFFFFHFELHVAVAFFFFRSFFLYASAHTAGCVFLMRHGSVKAFSMWLTSVNISNYAVNSVISNSLCMFTEKVLSQLQTQGCIPDSLPRSCLFPSVHHAVQHCLTILPRSLEVRTIYIYIYIGR